MFSNEKGIILAKLRMKLTSVVGSFVELFEGDAEGPGVGNAVGPGVGLGMFGWSVRRV